MNIELEYAVLRLHDIARLIEKELGFNGTLANDVRNSADRLHNLITAKVSNEAL